MERATPQLALVSEFQRRPVTSQAAKSGRRADRAAGVGANGGDRRTFLHAGRGAARGTAGQERGMARLRAIAIVGIFAGDTVSQRVHVRFTDNDGALRLEARGYGGVFGCRRVALCVEA